MQKHYLTPVLLVESVDGLQAKRPPTTATDSTEQSKEKESKERERDVNALAPTTSIEARLALLAMASVTSWQGQPIRYPRLRFVWTRDPAATAALFTSLKRGRKQPELDAALDAGT